MKKKKTKNNDGSFNNTYGLYRFYYNRAHNEKLTYGYIDNFVLIVFTFRERVCEKFTILCAFFLSVNNFYPGNFALTVKTKSGT